MKCKTDYRQPRDATATLCPVCRSGGSQKFQRVKGKQYWRCTACQCTFLDPSQRLDLASEKREYDQHQNNIDDPGYLNFLDRLAQPLLEQLPDAADGLDYGCGPCPAMAYLLRRAGHCTTLYDPIYAPDADALSRQYDFVTCSEVVEHFHRPADEFEQLDHLLKPGGWLAVMTTFQTDDQRFSGWHYRRDPTHIVFYRKSTMQAVGERHGWTWSFPAPNVTLFRKKS